ncbi:hypothetical protein ACXYMO_16040 [Arenibacterium sp. CAU 1754]
MKQVFIALILALWCSPAFALSCLRPDAAATFRRVADAPETYVVLHGHLIFDEAKLPKRPRVAPSDGPRPTQSVMARFKGQALNTRGFGTPFDREIRVDLTCAGAWCAAIENEERYLAFVERRAEGFVLNVDPCYSDLFPAPEPKVLKQMQSCFSGGPCLPRRR